MKKILSVVLSLSLLLLCAGALADSAVLNAECFDWGEAITSITLNLDEAPEAVPEVAIETTVTYLDYSIYQNVTETVSREITDARLDGNTLTLTLAYAPLNAGTNAYPNSAEAYKITVDGKEIADITLSDPAVDAFEARTASNGVNYRLYVPETDAEKVPLIVWLHGAGEMGTDNRIQISANLVTNWATPESQAHFGGAAYIMAPQAVSGHNAVDEMAAIEELLAKYPNIDHDRIYVGGCSMGGAGTVSIISTYPDFFAAAFPICPAAAIGEEAAAAFAANGMPVYLTHSIDDTTVNVNTSTSSYELLTKAGAEVHLTLFNHSMVRDLPEETWMQLGHWSWTYVHRNYDCAGDDEDGQQYHAGEYVDIGAYTNSYYNGEAFSYYALDTSVDGFSYYDNSTWTTYNGEPFDASLLTTEEVPYEYHVVSTAPSDLGYDTLFDWLAAQHK